MKKTVITLITLFAFVYAIEAQETRPQWQEGKIWVKVRADYPLMQHISFEGLVLDDPMNLPLRTLSFVEQMAPKFQITRLSRPFHMARDYEPLQNLYQIDFSALENVDVILKELASNPAVEYAERVPIYYTSVVTPNDTYYNSSYAWGLYKINAGTAWDYSTGSAAITVAVVDNAIEITHSDLAANIWLNTGEIANNGIDDDGNGYIDDRNGYDVADNDNNPNPPNTSFDHGTHVSGTVGAVSNNSTGVASIGYNISIIPVKSTTNASSPTSVTNGYDGIIYAANSGADVINMSWGGTSYSTTGQNVITYAHNQGCVLVAAAGNDDVSSAHYPSSYTYVISVASTGSTDAKSSFSNYGTTVDVSAPGSSIYSTLPGNTYGYMSGTSMASPLVAGLCGLMLSLNPALTPDDIETCLENSCVNIDAQNPSYINQLGAGRINAQAAMSCVSSTLAWAPQADFTANTTTISAGGSITFTDQSIYNPSSWNWTFTGGSTTAYNGQNPPAISYATPGNYTVSLQVTNANGTDIETKTNYITVLAATNCDTISNTRSGDNVYIRSFSSGNGYLGGHNGYQITRWADKFTNTYPAGTYLHYIDYYFVEGMTNSSTAYITATIWDATGAGGTPGAVIKSQQVLLQEIEDNQTTTGFYPTRVIFANPVALPAGDFFVGYTLTHAAGDTVCLASTQDLISDAVRPNTVYAYNTLGSGLWENFTTYITTELAFHVYLYATTLPVTASSAPAASTICEGEYVNLTSTGSTNETAVEWYFNGATINNSTQANPSVLFNTAGSYWQYLVAYNTCGYYNIDSTQITVNPSPVVSVSATQDTICPSGSTQLTASGGSTYLWSPPTGLSNAGISNPIATPSTTTTYTVQGAIGSCSDAVSITIVVDQPPTANFNYSPATVICEGSSVVFDGSISNNALTYNWTFSNGNPSGSSQLFPAVIFNSGSNDVKLVVENSCNSKDSITYTLVVLDSPHPYLGNDTSICTNTNLILDAGNGYSSYVWTGGSSATNLLTVNSSVVGSQQYTVWVVDGNGCEGGDTIQVTYENCAGITPFSSTEVFIHPNPSSDFIIIENSTGIRSITIYNSAGQMIQSGMEELPDGMNVARVRINSLAAGIYSVVVMNNSGKVSHGTFVKVIE